MKNTLAFSNLISIAGPLFGLAVVAIAATTIVAPVSANARPSTASASTMPAGDFTRAEAETRANTAFDRIDLNKDGVLDSNDRQARQRVQFDLLDSDGNGAINISEFEAIRTSHREMRAEMRGNRREGRIGVGPQRMSRFADSDADGKISKTEFRTVALKRFERADANDDGTISAEERRSQNGKMRGMGGRGHLGGLMGRQG